MRSKNCQKKVFQKCNHGYKNVACLYLVMVPDRPIVTIIDRQELIYSLSSHTMTCDLGDPEGHIHGFYKKYNFSASFDRDTSG